MTGPERTKSPSFLALRASARRVLRLIESEIARQGGCAVIFNDQLELCGSRRVWRPAMSELHALGLVEIVRYPKKYACRLSHRWCKVTTQEARIASATAREHCNDAGARPSRHAEHVTLDDQHGLSSRFPLSENAVVQIGNPLATRSGRFS